MNLRVVLLGLFVCCAPALAGEAEWQQHMNAGAGAYKKGDAPAATQAFEQALKEAGAFGESDPRLATTLVNLAGVYYAQGRYADAEPLFRRALAIYEKTLGPAHPFTATALANLGAVYQAQKRYREAEPLLQRALAIREKAAGPE